MYGSRGGILEKMKESRRDAGATLGNGKSKSEMPVWYRWRIHDTKASPRGTGASYRGNGKGKSKAPT